MAAAYTADYRLVSINEAGPDRINLSFAQVTDPTTSGGYGSAPVALNLPASEAAGYFPGQVYTVAFTKKA